jgi:plasmid stability protein
VALEPVDEERRAGTLECCGTVLRCYCARMRNITVSVPDEVYRRARIRAAERGTSVSALVAEHLRSLTDDDAEFARLEALQARVIADVVAFSGADRLTREQVHDRALR